MDQRPALPLLVLLASMLPAEAQTGGYNPRTWSYDRTQNVLLAPGALPQVRTSALRGAGAIRREIVPFHEEQPKGSIIIDTSERRLYFVLGNGTALRYVVGVGKEGFSWAGRDRISAKRRWPDWRPPPEMIAREAAAGRVLPTYVAGGIDNPLGARALYIGDTLYRIHGTNQPWTVGQANSSGCIRMRHEDVVDLYERVEVGAQVVVRH